MDYDECIKKGFIKKTVVDYNLIKSILEISDLKESETIKNEKNEHNIMIYVTLAYDSLREILECVCILKGYKVLNHVCIGLLL